MRQDLAHPDALQIERAAVVVGHGGHGTTMRALRHSVPVVGIPAKGLDQAPSTRLIEAWGAGLFTGIFKALALERELHVDRIIEEGDLATAQTHTTGTLTMLETSTTIAVLSRELWVLRKTGSQWRVVDYMFNSAERAAA